MAARVRLKAVAEIRFSTVDKKSVAGEVPIRLCNYTDVYYNDVITAGMEFMPATASPEQIRQFRLQPGDVLVTKDSETPDDIAIPALIGAVDPDLVAGYHLALIRPRSTLIDGRFLFYSLKSAAVRASASSRAFGITRFGLRVDAISELPISLPSLGTQQAIADYLDRETSRIDALIAAKRRMIHALEERWQAVMAAGVSGRLARHEPLKQSIIPWLPLIPSMWRIAKLNLVARLGSGHTPSRERSDWWLNPTIPWITTGEVSQMRSDRVEFITETREMISELGLANSSATLHPAGTVVLCRTASAGYSAIMGRDMATSQDFATWTCGPAVRPRFLLLCLRVMRQDLLGRLAMGSTHQTIYMPDIESIKIPLPPTAEQDGIVAEVYRELPAIDRGSSILERQIAILHERRQALITAAVAGQVQIPAVAV